MEFKIHNDFVCDWGTCGIWNKQTDEDAEEKMIEALIAFGFFVGGATLAFFLCYFIDWGYLVGASITIAIFSFVFIMMTIGIVLMLCGIPFGNGYVDQPLFGYIEMVVVGFVIGTLCSSPFHLSGKNG